MRSRSDTTDWSFARRRFWLFSHVFAVAVITTFVFLGLWQGDRHRDRAALNDIVAARSNPPADLLADVLATTGSPDDLEFRYVTTTGTFVEDDFVRVANRSQGGVAGDHVVAVLELADGQLMLVNRGFTPLGTDTAELAPLPTGPTTIAGWLRASADRGWIGATDTGGGTVVPRLDVDAIAARLDGGAGPGETPVVPVALQLEAGPPADADTTGGSPSAAGQALPDPVPLPPLDGGPHLSYMVQWFIFATLGMAFYGALLWRMASGRHRGAPMPEADDTPSGQPDTRRSTVAADVGP